MQRLNNPNRFCTSNLLPIEEIEGEKYRIFNQTIKYTHPRGCQCFKNCDCYMNYGKIEIRNVKWYRHIKFDGTDKAFYTKPYIPRDYKLNPYN